ncbi:MAG: hypothetical protein H8E55_51425 [Pelagibacterales bacterium]|nr:hypothetical protein [Pelagibacterales bacterium]
MWQQELEKIIKLLRFVNGAKKTDLAILRKFLLTERMSKNLRKQISDLYESHDQSHHEFLLKTAKPN